jgi:hypothetical protein
MKTSRTWRLRRAALFAVPVISAAAALLSSGTGAVASLAPACAGPVVHVDGGLVRGAAAAGVGSFLGLPYAAPPRGTCGGQAAGTSSQPAVSPAAAPSPSPAPAATPDTAVAARSAAQVMFALCSAGQYAAVYPLIDAHARAAVPEHRWVAVREKCPPQAAGLVYKVGRPVMAGQTAVMAVSLAGWRPAWAASRRVSSTRAAAGSGRRRRRTSRAARGPWRISWPRARLPGTADRCG